MKDFKNKILYIIVIVLVIAFMVLIGMVMNLMNRTSNIEKQETKTSQLTKTSSNNAYITTEEHLQELSQIQVSSEDIALKIYPVGSIYISTEATNPSELFGGTWESYGQGRTLVGVGTSDQTFVAGQTGGESNHTLTIAEMPSHSHNWTGYYYLAYSAGEGVLQPGSLDYSRHGQSTTTATGGSQAHNNLQPYIVTYMWKRIS